MCEKRDHNKGIRKFMDLEKYTYTDEGEAYVRSRLTIGQECNRKMSTGYK